MAWERLMVLGAVFGFVYGFLLQKGEFCFVSVFRDWFSFRYTRMAQAVVVLVLTALLGWATALTAGWAPLDRLWVAPVGWNSLLGGVLFGVGMAVAGAVALLGAARVGRPAVAAAWREAAGSLRGPLPELLRRPRWDARAVGFLLGITMTLQRITVSAWGITTAEARLAALGLQAVAGPDAVAGNAYLAGLFKGYPGTVVGPSEVLILAMVVGAAVAARLGGTFRLRLPRPSRLSNAVAGGVLMGFASRVAPGCNIGNIASGLPALSLHSLVATVGIGLGVYLVTAGVFKFQGLRVRVPAPSA